MKVTLYKPHTHAGQRLQPGTHDLPADAVAWLRANTDVLTNPNPKAVARATTEEPETEAGSGD